MARHTEGPWHKGEGNGEGMIFADNGRLRCENRGGTVLYPIASVVTGYGEEEDEANANVIAAAPCLLASLQDLTDWMLSHTGPADGTLEMLIKAQASISKAKGGEQL